MPSVLGYAMGLLRSPVGKVAVGTADNVATDAGREAVTDFAFTTAFNSSVNGEEPQPSGTPGASSESEILNSPTSDFEFPALDVYNSGINNSHRREPIPAYNASESEKVLNKASSFIILGKDRPDDATSGYGGKGNTHASAIDLVAGLGGILGREVNPEGEQVFTNKSPYLDSARIYLSQRTDIDDNFGLVEGSDPNLQAQSGIAIKADGVRIIGRQGIKLITSTDAYNSQGVGIDGEIAGIDLIAGNNVESHKLEPLVKGDQLTAALAELAELIRDVNGNVQDLLFNVIDLQKDYATHIHVVAPAVGGPTTPPNGGYDIAELAVDLISYGISVVGLYNTFANTKTWELNHLHPGGEGYINSRFNNTN